MKKYIVGNWKMNQNKKLIEDFFLELDKHKFDFDCEAWIAPQFIHVGLVQELAKQHGKIKVGTQNCSEEEAGAFTGEVSPAAIKDMDLSFVVLGHSERRALFGESNQLINKKLLKAFEQKLDVIFCVGETLEEREANKTLQTIEKQLEEGLEQVTDLDSLIIAYEPVWAIGTGKTATPETAQEVHLFIREWMEKKHSAQGAQVPLLYGGSVKPSNIKDLLNCKDIDGGRVGGASLEGKSFCELAVAASQFSC